MSKSPSLLDQTFKALDLTVYRLSKLQGSTQAVIDALDNARRALIDYERTEGSEPDDEAEPVKDIQFNDSNLYIVAPEDVADRLTDPNVIVTRVEWSFAKHKPEGPYTLGLFLQVNGEAQAWHVSDPGNDPDRYWNHNVEAVEANCRRNGIEWRKPIPRR
jgi:hypothetical protein